MALIICISDYWHHKQYYKLQPPVVNDYHEDVGAYDLEVLQSKKSRQCSEPALCGLVKRLKVDIDGISFFYLYKELLNFTEYRRVLSTQLALKGVQLIWLQIVQPARDIIDWKW